MPPSENMAYPTGRGGRRFKSKDLKKFQTDCYSVICSDPVLKKQAMVVASNWVKNQRRLEIHVCFYFKKEKLVTKTGGSKRLDVANRLKGICDSVSESLGFDDCEFWHVSCSKYCFGTDQKDWCNVIIRPLSTHSSIP